LGAAPDLADAGRRNDRQPQRHCADRRPLEHGRDRGPAGGSRLPTSLRSDQPRRRYRHPDPGPALVDGEHRRSGGCRLPGIPRSEPGGRTRWHELHGHHRLGEHELHLHGQGLRRRGECLRSIRTAHRDDPGGRHNASHGLDDGARRRGNRLRLECLTGCNGVRREWDRRSAVPPRRQIARSRRHLVALWADLGLDDGRQRIAHPRRAGAGWERQRRDLQIGDGQSRKRRHRPGTGRAVGPTDLAARGRDPFGSPVDDGQDPALAGRLLDRRPAVRPRPPDRTSSAPARRCSPTAACW
jgi:hypothetical protein